MKKLLKDHSFIASLLAALILGAAIALVTGAVTTRLRGGMSGMSSLLYLCLIALISGALLGYPLVLTGIEVFLLVRRPDDALRWAERGYDCLTIALGGIYSLFYLSLFHEVCFADWDVVLSNRQTHSPIATWHLPTVLTLVLVGAVGYLVLNWIPLRRLPPLVVVGSIAAMYLACGMGVLWGIQVVSPGLDLYLALPPVDLLLITARTIRRKAAEWNALERKPGTTGPAVIHYFNKILCRSKYWPLLALLLMWPLLGLLIGLLALFGQSPSAAIRAWTETSDWSLSQRVAPQNVSYDEHYLCTVAAGGHKRLVRPQRLGIRHGHQVIVDRQLCIANAFEQILEERTPRAHRALRRFYDNHGYPIARLIHSPWIADAIYLLMKPLEWLFLAVLYASDVCPEDRIALQYTGKRLEDFR